MALENFGTYTETDPNSRITKTTRRVTWTDLTRNEDAYVYKDEGVDYFGGDFVHFLTLRFTASEQDVSGGIWALTNDLDDLKGLKDANKDALYLTLAGFADTTKLWIALREMDGGTLYGSSGGDGSSYIVTVGTSYYLSFERDESVGTYGTLYLHIYSDAARTTKLFSHYITLHTSKKDFRYVHAIQTWNAGTTLKHSGYSENLDLEGAILPSVTVQSITSIAATTATGNGTIVDLGISAVSAHGWVWDSTIDPTTTDSSSGFWGSTDEGGGSVGVFSSSITNLLEGQEYWARPYAENGAGTAYGGNIKFTAGQGGTQLKPYIVTIKGTKIHYVDHFGTERGGEFPPV